MKKTLKIDTFLKEKIKKVNQSHFRLLLAGLLTFSIFACDEEKQLLDSQNQTSPFSMRKDGDIDKVYDERSSLQREFSKSLAKSLNQSKMLRDIIKTKALEMFDEDHDILYEMIKDERVENNITVEELITKNITDKKALKKLDTEYPTLTILVPTLPKDCFNPQKWNTATEIPKVAVVLNSTNDVPIIDGDGSEKLMEAKYTPGFPVVVVKENERVVTNKDSKYKDLKTKELTSKNGVKFKFLSESFDRKTKKAKSGRVAFNSSIDQVVRNAYDTYNNVDGWQRDFIYYGITPSQPNGKFKYDFKEGIKSFRMLGNPMTAYQKIAAQADGDPLIMQGVSSSGWTEGGFEFKVTTYVGNKGGGAALEIKTLIPINPQDLFELTYVDIGGWFNTVYLLTDMQLKTVILSDYFTILNWDLNLYSTVLKMTIEEEDPSVEIQRTLAVGSKFATNFGFEFGEEKKLGLKFGASSETTTSQTYTEKRNLGSDELGDVTVNFQDNVVLNKLPFLFGDNLWVTREYTTGYCAIGVEPIRVQGF